MRGDPRGAGYVRDVEDPLRNAPDSGSELADRASAAAERDAEAGQAIVDDGPPRGRLLALLVDPAQVQRRRIILTIFSILVVLACVGSLVGVVVAVTRQGAPQNADELVQKAAFKGTKTYDFPAATRRNNTDWAPLTAASAAVATDHANCSAMGRNVLLRGGNAVDAAVTSALCLGLMNPMSSGIGGGAFIVVRMANGTEDFIDGRETAPAGAWRDMFVGRPLASRRGGASVAVPGELRALELAHRRHGRLPWRALVEPVAEAAEAGFPVGPYLARTLATPQYLEEIKGAPALAAVYAPGGVPLKEGQLLRRPDLAATLRRIAREGADAFYTGSIAEAIVGAVRAAGGNMTLADLAGYRATASPPLASSYRGLRLLGAPPPSSGGAALAMLLNILEGYPLGRSEAQLSQQRAARDAGAPPPGPAPEEWVTIVEAMKHVYADRMALGDPVFAAGAAAAAERMASKGYAAEVRRKIVPDRSFPPGYYGSLVEQKGINGTSHVSIVDADRNAVAMTTTINLVFGSHVVAGDTGILLNDEMDDFSSPNASNAFGYPPSAPNFVAPGKRPLSSMSPTIFVRDGAPRLVVGASGGSVIISATALAALNVIDYGMDVRSAVDRPRVHRAPAPPRPGAPRGAAHAGRADQHLPDACVYEPEFAELESKGLLRLLAAGEHLERAATARLAVVQAVALEAPAAPLTAASDFRKSGAPAGY